MKKEITFAYVHILHPHELAIKATCSYFDVKESFLLSKSKTHDQTSKKSLLFYLLKTECKMSDTEIANIFNVSRQYVNYLVDRVDVRSNLYLTNALHYKNIRFIFSNLLKEQKEWLEKHSL